MSSEREARRASLLASGAEARRVPEIAGLEVICSSLEIHSRTAFQVSCKMEKFEAAEHKDVHRSNQLLHLKGVRLVCSQP